MTDADHVLKIYRAASGDWSGRIFHNGEELGAIAGCLTPEAVADAAADQGLACMVEWPVGSSRPRALTGEQMAVVLAVLKANHDYYCAQGMSPLHMHPEEVANEIRNNMLHPRIASPGRSGAQPK